MEKHSLNEEQLAAVSSSAPRVLVIAGPGSGKSTTLVARIRELIARGADPRRIIVMTFTNAAADELVRRLGGVKLGWCGTLHGFCLRLLQKHGSLVGLPKSLSVIDDEQKQSIVESIVDELNSKASAKAVAELLEDVNLVENKIGFSYSKEDLIALEYHRRLRRAGLLDFFTILYRAKKLIQCNAFTIASEFDHLLVDEFQDSAALDFQIYEAMEVQTKFLVGDPDQGIFGFRGGEIKNILDLSRHNAWETHTLQTNHRSKRRICDAAQMLIENNSNRYPKHTEAVELGGVVVCEEFNSPAGELAFVTSELAATTGRSQDITGLAKHSESVAVLARTNRIAESFAEHLKGLGIPVAEKKHEKPPEDWRKAKLVLTVMSNPYNDLAAYQYLVARDGKEKASQLKREAAKQMQSLGYALAFATTDRTAEGFNFALVSEGISADSRARIHDAARTLSGRGEWTLNDLILFLNAGEERTEQIGHGVTVTTLHSSKGREFDCCYLVGMEEGVCPSARKDTIIEEERRLFYVALTRARNRVVVTWCNQRAQNRGPNLRPGPMEKRERSRFVKEAGL